MNNIEELLKEVKNISQRYEEIAKIAGDNYNVFEVLNIRSKEDSHSRILTNILDPKGIHDCGDIFLRLFFEKFLHDKNNIDFSNCQVYREYYAKELGRPDICIFCQDFGIVIENKIDAPDQGTQLSRYDELLKKKYGEKKYRLFYLTKDGREASKESHCNVEYIRLAYYKDPDVIEIENSNLIKNDILSWIKCCQEKVFNKPLIRETLEQYINMIKIITGQTRSIIMSKDILKMLAKDADNIEAAFEIGENFRSLKLQKHLIHENLFQPLAEWAATEHNDLHLEIKTEIETEKLWKKWFKVITVEKKEWCDKNFRICFEFGEKIAKFEDLHYGLTFTKDCPINKNPEIVEKLRHSSTPPTPEWYQLYPFKECNNWYKNEFAILSKPDNAIVEYFIDKIESLLKFLKEQNLI